ncbi:hypothetical protein MFM001_12760 [Mycobacterium sp. MFM001]|nr:hypothetical protein MFM001_12760 [Mycobacterium sp. MFM001]
MMSSAVFSDTEALSFAEGIESNAVIEALSFTGRDGWPDQTVGMRCCPAVNRVLR